jgi:hypothetical protein
VVSVREGVINYIPGLFKAKLFFVDQNSKKLNSGNSWVSIVQLDLVLLSEQSELISAVVLFVSSNNIIN